MFKNAYTATALCAVLFGCGGAEPQATPELGPANVLLASCPQVSTLRPRYWARQGQSLDGLTGQSFTVSSARFGCHAVEGLGVQATKLQGTVSEQPVAGSDFLGSALLVRDAAGVWSEVAITQIEIDAQDMTGETQLYTLVTLDPSGQSVRNVCKPDAEGRGVAMPLRGRWDESGKFIDDGSLSFHCTAGVVAKCARWGYRPWQSFAGQPLDRYHQACTRMARADYCGDGQSQTREGTQIDMYDGLGLHSADLSLLGLFEASWTTGGAYCIARDRWLSIASLLTPACQSQFYLSLQPNPLRPTDLCFARRTGTLPEDALLSNRSQLNLGI